MSSGNSDIWIQGAGELASGVACRLFRCGYRIIMAEIANPMAVRRLVAFSEAVYEGRVEVEGIPGELVEPQAAGYRCDQIGVVIDPQATALARLGAAAVIDARITKQKPQPLPIPRGSRGPALHIGLGPGFVCGQDADLVIETHRGACLGEVIRQGSAAANTGIPGVLGGQSARRVLRAPAAGHLEPLVAIGDLVDEGQVVGLVAGQPVVSALAGQVRGLVHRRAELFPGEKVGDVDPRGLEVDAGKVSDKALAIAGGVLEALLSRNILPFSGEKA